MTPKISLIVGIAATALAVGVPTAFGERQLVGPPGGDSVAYFYANERATLVQSPQTAPHGDSSATAAFYADTSGQDAVAAFYANERATLVEQGGTGVDQIRLDPSGEPSPTVSVSSGSEIAWSQLGIGFGLG